MARESALDYELAKQLGMTLNEVREQGLGAALEDSKSDIAAGRLYSMEEVEAYVNATHVALFGGSFDPPTVGHIAFARFLSEHFDEVWIVPCPTHMFGKDMSPASARIEMCRLAFGHISNVVICDYEIHYELSGAAIDFVCSLLANPTTAKYVLHYTIGMDNANNIHKWVDFEKLLKLIPFVVVPRVGQEIDVTIDWYEKPPHKLLVPDHPLPETASSDVRNIIKNHGDFDRLSELITAPIFEFIRARGLYVS